MIDFYIDEGLVEPEILALATTLRKERHWVYLHLAGSFFFFFSHFYDIFLFCFSYCIFPSFYLIFFKIGNKIDVPRLKMITDALHTNRYLQELDLSGFFLNKKKIISSTKKKKKKKITENEFGEEGVALICEVLQRNKILKKLNLSSNFFFF